MISDERTIFIKSLRVSITDSLNDGPCVVLLHDIASCKEVFNFLKRHKVYKKYRLISIDLPGHGKSSDARDPSATYSIRGYADIVYNVIVALRIPQVTLVGWSLGGHIAIDLMARFPEVTAVMVIGSPAADPRKFLERLSADDDITDTMTAVYGPSSRDNPTLVAAARRADHRARTHIFKTFTKEFAEGHKINIETLQIPLAFVCGDSEASSYIDYLCSLKYANMWQEKIHIIPNSGHACFMDNTTVFMKFFSDFLAETETSLLKNIASSINFLNNFDFITKLFIVNGAPIEIVLLNYEWQALIHACENRGLTLSELFASLDCDDACDISEAVSLFLLRYFRTFSSNNP